MDDFGTGYSSLLKTCVLSVDKIKIDVRSSNRSTQLDQAATIVPALLGLCRGLSLPSSRGLRGRIRNLQVCFSLLDTFPSVRRHFFRPRGFSSY